MITAVLELLLPTNSTTACCIASCLFAAMARSLGFQGSVVNKVDRDFMSFFVVLASLSISKKNQPDFYLKQAYLQHRNEFTELKMEMCAECDYFEWQFLLFKGMSGNIEQFGKKCYSCCFILMTLVHFLLPHVCSDKLITGKNKKIINFAPNLHESCFEKHSKHSISSFSL